jgi:sugar lactone lactonase YvrE
MKYHTYVDILCLVLLLWVGIGCQPTITEGVTPTAVTGFPMDEQPAELTANEYRAQLEAIYPDDICVSIHHGQGYVTVMAPWENGGKYTGPCGVTGVGAYDVVEQQIMILIDGEFLPADGHEIYERDDEQTFHGGIYQVTLPDGGWIQFGTLSGISYEDYQALLGTLTQIVASYISTEPVADIVPEASPSAEQPGLSKLTTGAVVLFARDNDLWRADINGQNVERLTAGGLYRKDVNEDDVVFLQDPRLSPDGRWLTYANDFRQLLLVDVTKTRDVQFLLATDDLVAWSPDSRAFAYVLNRTLFVYDVNSGVASALHTEVDQFFKDVVWSPDGRFIAFACCFVEDEETYPLIGQVKIVNVETGTVEIAGDTWLGIASGPPGICWPADGQAIRADEATNPVRCSLDHDHYSSNSPDGSRRAFPSTRSPEDDVIFRLLVVEDKERDDVLWQRELAFTFTLVRWSPDGNYLLLRATDDNTIWRVPADGGGEPEQILSNAELLNVVPEWALP